jgi:hypothetical protein
MKSHRIHVGGMTWRVRLVKKHPLLLNKKKGYDDGYCDPNTCQILIKSTNPVCLQKSTYLHELIHVVEFANCFRIPEKNVVMLESGLFQILHDNRLRF